MHGCGDINYFLIKLNLAATTVNWSNHIIILIFIELILLANHRPLLLSHPVTVFHPQNTRELTVKLKRNQWKMVFLRFIYCASTFVPSQTFDRCFFGTRHDILPPCLSVSYAAAVQTAVQEKTPAAHNQRGHRGHSEGFE